MESALLLLSISVLMIIGVPIGISIGLGIITVIAVYGIAPAQFLAQSMYSGLDSFPLMAIPVFMLAGSIMDTGGLSKRLINVAKHIVGNMTGGLGMVAIIACFFFGAISGSAPATVGAVGSIMIPYMVKAGYDRDYSTALCACAGGLGIIVPPSIPFVVYGCATMTSVSDLFLAGIGPAIVVASILIAVSYVISKKNGYTSGGQKFEFKALLRAVWEAKWALFLPVIILGGIYSGIFTPTEAAVIAVAYGIFIGKYVYRELTWKGLLGIFNSSTTFVGGFMMTFAPATALGAIFALLHIPDMVRDGLLSVSSETWVILLIINLVLLVIGMLMDAMSAIIIFAPIIYQILTGIGIDPVHIGIIITINLAVGFVTPPVCSNLFVASGLTGIPIDRIVRKSWPFVIALIAAVFIVTYIPQISLSILNFV